MDRVLHLIDFLFELNIKPCNLKIENIEKTGKVPDEIISMLEDFNKQIKTIRNEQNSVKHQRSYSDNWLDDFSNSEFLITNTSEIDMKKSLKRKSPHLKIYLKELKRGSLKNNLIFSKFINSILNSLYSQHQLRLKAYTLIS